MTTDQRQWLERIEMHRLERTGDQFAQAWDAAELAAQFADRQTPEAFAILWTCLRTAVACENRLNDDGRSSQCDTYETAAERITRYLDRATGTVLDTLAVTA